MPHAENQPERPKRKRSAMGGIGRRVALLAIPPLLAIVLAVALLPRGASQAATLAGLASSSGSPQAGPQLDNVQWTPGSAQELLDESGCYAQMNGTINTSSASLAQAVSGEISKDEQYDPGNGSGVKTIVIYGNTVSGSSVNFTVDGWYLNGCPGPTDTPGATLAPGSPSPAASTSATVIGGNAGLGSDGPATVTTAMIKSAVVQGPASNWVTAGVAALAAAAAYLAVTVATAAAVAALIPEIAAGTASAAAVTAATALSGCVGGVASTAVAMLIAGSANLSSALSGCLTGAAAALLPISQLGQAISSALRGFFGGAATAQVAELAGIGLATASSITGETSLIQQSVPSMFQQVEDDAASASTGPAASQSPGASPSPADTDCPATGPCEQVIKASDGNTYYCDNYGGGRGYVTQVGANGKVSSTIEVTVSQNSFVIAPVRSGRQLTAKGGDPATSGIFSGAGTSGDVPVNTFNVNGNGYVEYAADPSRILPPQLRAQVVGGDGVVYTSNFYNRQDPKLQSAIKDYMQGTAALNTAMTRLQSLFSGIGGVSATAVVGLIVGVSTKAFTETNTITALAAITSVAVGAIVQVYNGWRDVDTARNNLINLYNNLAVSAGGNSRPIPLIAFGGITATNVGQNPFHSYRFV